MTKVFFLDYLPLKTQILSNQYDESHQKNMMTKLSTSIGIGLKSRNHDSLNSSWLNKENKLLYFYDGF